MQSSGLLDYFRAIELDTCEVPDLFDILDADQSQSLNASEIAGGCLRLSRPAKVLEVQMLGNEVTRTRLDLSHLQESIEALLDQLVAGEDSPIAGSTSCYGQVTTPPPLDAGKFASASAGTVPGGTS